MDGFFSPFLFPHWRMRWMCAAAHRIIVLPRLTFRRSKHWLIPPFYTLPHQLTAETINLFNRAMPWRRQSSGIWQQKKYLTFHFLYSILCVIWERTKIFRLDEISIKLAIFNEMDNNFSSFFWLGGRGDKSDGWSTRSASWLSTSGLKCPSTFLLSTTKKRNKRKSGRIPWSSQIDPTHTRPRPSFLVISLNKKMIIIRIVCVRVVDLRGWRRQTREQDQREDPGWSCCWPSFSYVYIYKRR